MDAAKGPDFYSKRVDDTFKHRWQDGSKWISIWTLRFMARDWRFRGRGLDKSLMRDSCCSTRQSSLEYIRTYFFQSLEIYGMKQRLLLDRQKWGGEKEEEESISHLHENWALLVCVLDAKYFSVYIPIVQAHVARETPLAHLIFRLWILLSVRDKSPPNESFEGSGSGLLWLLILINPYPAY